MKQISSLLAAALSASLAGCNSTDGGLTLSGQDKPMLADAELRPLTEAEKLELSRMLGRTLKDPDSAQWRWALFPKITDGTVHYCAQVNAKNSYGGYNGFNVFISRLEISKGKIVTGGIVGIDDNRTPVVPELCRKQGLNPYKTA